MRQGALTRTARVAVGRQSLELSFNIWRLMREKLATLFHVALKVQSMPERIDKETDFGPINKSV